MKGNIKECGVSKRGDLYLQLVVGYWNKFLFLKLASNSQFGKQVLSISLGSSIRLRVIQLR